jgi:hypothetical protein
LKNYWLLEWFVKEKDYTKQTRAYTRSHGIVLEVFPKDQNVIIDNTHQHITPTRKQAYSSKRKFNWLVTYLARQGPHNSVLVCKIYGVCIVLQNINCGLYWFVILCSIFVLFLPPHTFSEQLIRSYSCFTSCAHKSNIYLVDLY